MMAPLFILEGNGAFLNRGCEAIFRESTALLREAFGPCRIVNAPYTSEQAPDFQEEDPLVVHRLPLANRQLERWTRTWWRGQLSRVAHPEHANFALHFFDRYLPEALAVLGIGGDNFSLDYGLPYSYFDTVDFVLSKGKPFILWGASVGPFAANPRFERHAIQRLKRMTLICARESATVAYLQEVGITNNVRRVADPAFLLAPVRPNTLAAEWIEHRRAIGINLSPLLGRYFADDSTWLRLAVGCVESVLEAIHLPVLLVPHVFLMHPRASDYAFLMQVKDQLSHYGDRLAIAGPEHNAAHMKWLISRLEAFAGARTHATIAALSSHVPTLSIAYSMKARGLNQDIFGHDDWLLAAEQLTPDLFGERMQALCRAGDSIRQDLAPAIEKQRIAARSAASHLRQVLSR